MRRAFIEWCVLTVLLLTLAIGLSIGTAESVAGRVFRIDASLYDFANQQFALPADSNLVLIEIDEASLAQIGRWPWPRTIHVALLSKLSEAGASVVGLDLLMAEPSQADQTLAKAIEGAKSTVVLPVTSETDRDGAIWPVYPVYEAGQQAELGHAHFSFDNDGIVRGLYLEEGGLPAFSLSAVQQQNTTLNNKIVKRALNNATKEARGRVFREGNWSRSEFALLPGVLPVTQTLSYAQVLRSEPDELSLQGKTVLVGATAAGMRDAFSNAIIVGETISPGVNLHAAAITALNNNQLQRRAPALIHAIVIFLIVAITQLVLYRTRPRTGLVATAIAIFFTVALSIIVLRLGYWLPPAGTLITLVIAYPLWSWRRLEAVVTVLARQAKSLRRIPTVLMESAAGADLISTFRPERESPRLGFFSPPIEPVALEMRELRASADQITGLRLLLATVLETLPRAALVCDTDGTVMLRNQVARSSFPSIPTTESVWSWFEDEFVRSEKLQAFIAGRISDVSGLEAHDTSDRDWLIASNRVQAPGLPTLWLIQFADITEIRELQRQREEMMRFISHDLRSPQVSIISALDQIPDDAQNEWTEAVKTYASQSLELAESFVQWSRAESKPFEEEELDLTGIVTEAVDATWARRGQLSEPVKQTSPETAVTIGDAQLLRRAVGNLIENAIKYGGEHNAVHVSLEQVRDSWEITVSDTGPGLGDVDTSTIFNAYVRGSSQTDLSGTGLGLAFVRMVALRHGGAATAKNRTGGGAEFKITIPAQETGAE